MHHDRTRDTLIRVLADAIQSQPSTPSRRRSSREAARSIVGTGPAPAHLASLVRTYLSQVDKAWTELISAMGHAGVLDLAQCRDAHRTARDRHRREGTPQWITGRSSPSGCAVCGLPERTHTDAPPFRPHRFETLLRQRYRPGRRAPAERAIYRRMAARRAVRAALFRDRGYDPCRVCGVPSAHHPELHIIVDPLIREVDEWLDIQSHEPPSTQQVLGDPDQHYIDQVQGPRESRDPFCVGPYEPPTDTQVLTYLARVRARRWDDE